MNELELEEITMVNGDGTNIGSNNGDRNSDIGNHRYDMQLLNKNISKQNQKL